MSNNGADRESPRATPPRRPRHQITRSISELSSPIRLHRHDHSSHVRKERERDERITPAQSTGPSLNAMDSLPGSKSEGVTPNLSPNPSRRPSVRAASGDDPGIAPGLGYAGSRKLSREEQLRQERQKAAARVTGLETTLDDLNTFSNATTRRLDDTYYSVLEKLGMLQSTIIALKELAAMSHETNDSFKKESDELAGEISSQLDSFDQFEGQEKRIGSLKDRIHTGREKIDALSHRVDTVRERIEGWERADREWQERTRRRLKVMWVITSAIAFVLALLLLIAQYVPASLDDAAVKVANESADYLRSTGQGDGATHVVRGGDDRGVLGSVSNGTAGDPAPPPDERLRVFDEL